MGNPRLLLALNLLFVGVPPRARAQTAQPNRMFYGVAAGASADGLLNVDGSGSDITGLMVTASIGRQLRRWADLQLDAFVGHVGLIPDQRFPTQGPRAADSLPTVARATSVAGLTASGRFHTGFFKIPP